MALQHPFCQCDDPGPGPGPGPGPDPGPITLAGDVTGPSDDTTVEAIQGVPVEAGTPSHKDVLTFDVGDGKAKWQAPHVPDAADIPFDPSGTGLSAADVQGAIVEASGILATVEIPLPTTGTPTDELVYTVPACIDATITFVLLSVEEQLVGAGDITVRIGTTAGDDDLIIDHVIDSTTPIGHVAGKDISTLGSAWPASSGYVLDVKENDEIHVRVTTSGTVDSGKIRVTVVGVVIP